MMKPELHIAVAVIRDDQGRVLITRRPDHVHKGGYWEFPGGKVEVKELIEQALVREINEELGILVGETVPLIRIPYEYDEHHVLLDVWEVTRFSGEPHGREGQPMAWVAVEQLSEYPFPEANLPIMTAVALPQLYMITGGPADHPEQFMSKLKAALERGIRLVQLRAKGLNEDAYLTLAKEAVQLCHDYGAKLLLNASPSVLNQVPDADGVQLSSDRLTAYSERPVADDKLLGASCHSLEQLRHAEQLRVDFALLSPVLATKTHPHDEPLGWAKFQLMAEGAAIPVYALGGMTGEMALQARTFGGQGIAAISALWEL
jgi:8-oxo-dGTP diphosphatase